MLMIDYCKLCQLYEKPVTGQWTGGQKKSSDSEVVLGGFSLLCIFEIFNETELLCGRTTRSQKVIQVYNQNIMNLPENYDCVL